jgi:hypothetical protein
MTPRKKRATKVPLQELFPPFPPNVDVLPRPQAVGRNGLLGNLPTTGSIRPGRRIADP